MAWDQKPNPQGYSKDWKRIRNVILQRDRQLCKLKLPGCTIRADEVDHIDGDVENNSHDNLRSLCSKCHSTVTKQNWRDSRNLMNPRTSGVHPADLVEDIEQRVEAIKEQGKEKAKFIDDTPTENEDEWITSFGPVFSKLENGKFVIPEKTLGFHIIKWMMENLLMNGKPYKPTKEQARIIAWMYSLDTEGNWAYNRTLHIAPKGWGKDPFGAVLCAAELCGPVRFSHWDTNGNPVPKRVEGAWVQIAAVSLTQNENTLRYLKGIFTPEAAQRYQIEEQSETIYAFGRKSKLQSISSSSSSLEGNQISYCHISETQHWTASNGCHKLFRVLSHNLAKVDNSRYYAATNSYDPNEDSIAQRLFEKYQDSELGIVKKTRLLVVAKMATHKAPTERMEDRMKVLNAVYGSSTAYTNVKNFAEMFDDKTNDPMELKRFFYNCVGIESMSFIDIRDWDRCIHPDYNPDIGVPKGTKIILAGDMSKNDDATCLIGMVVEGKLSGMIFVIGLWEQPKNKEIAKTWMVPREEVNAAVERTFKDYRVQAFWVDPSHKMDDEGGSYWMPLINQWHKTYSRRIPLNMWAKGTEHAINWDMASHANQRSFVDSLATMEQLITDNQIRHDGNSDLRRHFQNARRFKSKRFGSTIAKESPRSKKKIDAAVTATVALTMYNKLMLNRKTRTTNMAGYTVPERG